MGLEDGTVEEMAARLAFVEARLALLERAFGGLEEAGRGGAKKPEAPAVFACNEPGLPILRAYPTEQDEMGIDFCWVGNDGPIQFVLPVRPSHPSTCVLRLQPHRQVRFDALAVEVNGAAVRVEMTRPTPRLMEVSFAVAASAAPAMSIVLLGVGSVRPSDLGENADERRLAARFYGARVEFA